MINANVRNNAYRVRELLLSVIGAVADSSGKPVSHTVEVRFYDDTCAEVIVWHYLPEVAGYREKQGYGVIITPDTSYAEINSEIVKMIHHIGEEA